MRAEPVTELFDEWVLRFRRGERPDPQRYLMRAGAERDELAALIEGYLVAAPRPEPDPETAELVAAWMRGESPLVVLRVRRGLSRDGVLDALSARFGLAAEKRPALRDRYHELEAGLLDPTRLSGRLVAALAELLQTSEDAIRAWRPRRLEAEPAYRARAEPQFAASYRLLERDEEVDRLFLSDPDAGSC